MLGRLASLAEKGIVIGVRAKEAAKSRFEERALGHVEPKGRLFSRAKKAVKSGLKSAQRIEKIREKEDNQANSYAPENRTQVSASQIAKPKPWSENSRWRECALHSSAHRPDFPNNCFDLTIRPVMVRAGIMAHEPRQARIAGQAYVMLTPLCGAKGENMKMKSERRALDKIYKRRNRYEIPEWQRDEVWPVSKKQNLIDSILRDWKLPKFYFLKTNDNPESFDVVDGQQRLSAIFEYLDNELQLSPKSADKFGGSYYKDLSDAISDKFDDYEIEYDLIEEGTDEEVKEYFQRLQEGMQLTSSEKLNSMHSNVRDFAAEISSNQFFGERINVSNKRHGHFDIACKVIAIEIDGLDAGTRYEDIRTLFESYASLPNTAKEFARIRRALKLLCGHIPAKRNQASIESYSSIIYYLDFVHKGR